MVIFQKPNVSSIVTAVLFVAYLIAPPMLAKVVLGLFIASLCYWSFREVKDGDSGFRQLLGVAGFAFAFASLIVLID